MRKRTTVTAVTLVVFITLIVTGLTARPAEASWYFQTTQTPAPVPQPVPAPGTAPAPAPTPSSVPSPYSWYHLPVTTSTSVAKSTSAPTAAPAQQPAAGLTSEEQMIVDLVNQARAQYGLRPLAVDMQLVQQARLKAQDMRDKNYFSHTSPTYGTPYQQAVKAGIRYQLMMGENIAKAYSAAYAEMLFMNSPGHRANILRPEYTNIGVGVVHGATMTYVVQWFAASKL